jgi:bifunctional ADP-heptose synthase (sugar kinase/adenylyltransferase)
MQKLKVEALPTERIVSRDYLVQRYLDGLRYSLTFGSFDLVHLYHVLYINSIKKYKPELTLVVAIDGDLYVKMRKGNERPIFNFLQRALSILVMSKADYVVEHSGNDLGLIKVLLPLLVVYSETTTQESIESRQPIKDFIESYGGEMAIGEAGNALGISTTKIINKIK